MSAAATNFGSFMNALAFVCVAIKIGRKVMPRTQLEVLGQALKETRAGIKEASVLGINLGGFEDALRRYVLPFYMRRIHLIYVRTLSDSGSDVFILSLT